MWKQLSLAAVLVAGGAAYAAKTEAPKPLPTVHAGVGRMVPDLTGTAVDGTKVSVAELAKANKAVVVAVTSSSCPLSKKFAPTLAAVAKEYVDKKVAFVLVAPIATDTADELKDFAKAAGLTAPILRDADGALAKALAATTTTEVFVIDAKRTVTYRGAIDDQYGLGYSSDAPKHTYLKDAVDAAVAGRVPPVPATTAPGCALDLASAKAPAAKVEYHNRVSRIVQANCQECHTKGAAGPFALDTLADLKAHKGMVAKVVDDGTMPPWHAKGDTHTTFVNDRSLPAADKADLLAWLASDMPEGNAADAPLPRAAAPEWAIGKPDLVVTVPTPMEVKATGVMKYQRVIVDTGLTEDQWITAAEIHPTARQVVHHILVYMLPPKKEGEIDLPHRGEEQGFFAAYVPGNDHQFLPDGLARKLPKGARIKFELHYTPNGTAAADTPCVGFRFADKPPVHELRVLPVGNPKIEIPPGEADHKETAEYKLPVEGIVTALSPHMHVRATACKYEAVLPDGTVKLLLDVPHYDFNWQHRYQFAEPVTLPPKTTVRFTVWYDNSDKNRNNPNPKATVRWGPQTTDEMLLAYSEFYIPAFALKKDEKK